MTAERIATRLMVRVLPADGIGMETGCMHHRVFLAWEDAYVSAEQTRKFELDFV
jgi:hypothetical protein